VFGVTFGWLLRDERLGTAEAAGGLLVVVGVYLVVTSAARAAAGARRTEPVHLAKAEGSRVIG